MDGQMEVPLEEEIASGTVEERPEVEVLNASDEAINFLASIEVAELQKCMFSDSLVTVSEGGRELGEFIVTVEFANRFQKPCLLLRAQSHGEIDSTPCGTAITAYLSTDLETLEQDHHEYIKLKDHRLDRRCHMSQHNGQMRIDKVTSVGEEVTKESVSYPLSILRGLVTEGANLLLMRLLALRRKVPDSMTFLSLDQESRLTHTIYSELGLKQLETGCETVEVFGLERKIDSVEDMAATSWHCYFLPDGHMASRVQIGSPVTMKLVLPPSELRTDLMEEKPVFEKRPLVWEEDMQMRSKFLDRKEELKADHASYLREHPELRALMADFLQLLLLKKPDDIFLFAREYFLPFASRRSPGQNLKTPLI